jgi:plastocyanin
MRKASVTVIALALTALGLVACGSSGGGDTTAASAPPTETTAPAGGSGASETLDISTPANGTLAYNQTSLNAKAGAVTISFDNPSATPHNVTIQDPSGKDIGATDTITQSTASAAVNLKPGTYTFFCSVPGHREAGMQGTITVK